MFLRFATLALCSLSLLAHAQTFPEGLEHLSALVNDERALVDGLRAFDKTELAEARREYEEAENLQKAGKADEARALLESAAKRAKLVRQGYERALEYYPQNARLHNYLGEILYDLFGEEILALNAWQRAVSLDGKLAEAQNNLGLHYFHIGRYELGLKYLDEAIKLDKKHPDFLFNMAQIYLIHWPEIRKLRGWNDKRIYREAMKLSERAAKYAPEDFQLQQDYAVNFFAADRFGEKANWKKAAQAWEKARPLATTREQRFYTWLNEARVWIADGKDANAIRCLEEAQRLIPDSEVVQKLLSEARARQAG